MVAKTSMPANAKAGKLTALCSPGALWRSLITPPLLTLGVLVVAGLSLVALVGPAPAAAEGPWWQLASHSLPTNLPPGGEGKIVVTASNLGDVAVSGAGTPVIVTDRLPAGLKATAVEGLAGVRGIRGVVECTLVSSSFVECVWRGEEGGVTGLSIPPYERLEVEITVELAKNASSGEDTEAKISGGGLPDTSVRQPVVVGGAPIPFGVERYELAPFNEDGSFDTKAGSHPFQLTTTLALNEDAELLNSLSGPSPEPAAPALAKDLHFKLPPGLIGNPTPFPRCTETIMEPGSFPSAHSGCSADTAVGVATVTIEASNLGPLPVTSSVPVFNLAPLVGEPARFGFEIDEVPAFLDTAVRTGGDYGVVVSVDNISQNSAFLASEVTFWGVPGDSRHDNSRGWGCVKGLLYLEGENELGPCPVHLSAQPQPFLTLPTSCTGSLQTTVQADSWTQPGNIVREYAFPFGLDGCDQLPFGASIEAAPDGEAASTPTGLTVGVKIPQQADLNPEGLATADVKDTTVALPAGVQLSPSGGNGLQACSNAQIGFTGVNPQTGTDEFTPTAPSCPNASKIATVKIKTPLLPNPLEGAVYLAAPQNFAGLPLENPFGSLIAMYLVAEDPVVSGVLVKLPGKVMPNPVTGQLVTTFENTPQLPFEDLELHFFGGERAPLSTPASCGSYTTQASFTPWSGNAAVEPSSNFDITSGPNGAPCPDPRPFAPGFQAGSTNLQAGAFTPFTTTMTRPDADQTLGRIEMQIPAGLSGTLSNVKLCGEPQAAQGTCGPESEIGHGRFGGPG